MPVSFKISYQGVSKSIISLSILAAGLADGKWYRGELADDQLGSPNVNVRNGPSLVNLVT